MEKALVAVSGGSDSLALLHILLAQKQYHLIVAHVNYNYRDSAKRDEKIVSDFCGKYNLKLHILNLDSRSSKEGNFEDWARVQRYKYFKEIYDKEKCVCLFVGHHKDDAIETYLMQKQRNAIVENYGLKRETIIQGMKVIRPLLEYSKEYLEDYCNKNHIEYGIDETNFDVKYSRNRIRKEIISKLNDEKKDNLIQEINFLNKDKNEHVEEIKKKKQSCLLEKNVISIDEFEKLSKEDKKEVIYYFLIDNLYKKISIKNTRIEDILKKISSNKPNVILACYDDITLYKEYNLLVIEKNKKEYCYPINDIEEKSLGKEFVITISGRKLEKVIASEEQFPLFLKNYDGNNPKVNRIFIDKKIPLRKRKSWPVIVDKFGTLLLVIGIKKFYNELCDFKCNFVEFYVHESGK